MVFLLILFSEIAFASSLLQDIDLNNLTPDQGIAFHGYQYPMALGVSTNQAGDFNADGIDDFIIGAPDTLLYTSPGTAYLIFGTKGQTPNIDFAIGPTNTQGIKFQSQANGDGFGFSVKAVGDINGDGISDLAIGTPYHQLPSPYTGTFHGCVYVLFGHRNPASSIIVDPANLVANKLGFAIYGANGNAVLGTAVDSVGDVNGDGIDDLVTGSNGASEYAPSAGSAYVIFGSRSPFSNIYLSGGLNNAIGFTIKGAAMQDFFGLSVACAGDVNGDGVKDLIGGALGGGGSTPGRAYVIFGRKSGFSDILLANSLIAQGIGFKIEGSVLGDTAGWSVNTAGDINGDGIDDMIVGARTGPPTETGATYVIFGRKGGINDITLDSNLNNRNQGFRIIGADINHNLGYHVSPAGDVNGDGISDLMTGTRKTGSGGSINEGVVYVIFGRKTRFSDINLAEPLDTRKVLKISGLKPMSEYDKPFAFAGDVNADGGDDLIIGSSLNTDLPGTSGAAYVIYGIPKKKYETIKELAEVKEVAGQATQKAAMIITLINFSNIGAMWFNCLVDLLKYVRYLQIEYPEKLHVFLEEPDLEFISIPYLSSFPEDLEVVKHTIPQKFEEYDFHSSFLINFWSSATMIIIILSLIIIACIFSYSFKSSKLAHPICISFKRSVKWNYLLAVITSYFGDIALYTFFETRIVSFDAAFNWISFFTCLIMNLMVVGVSVLIYIINLKLKMSKKTTDLSDKNSKFKEVLEGQLKDFEVVFEGYKENSMFQQTYLLIFSLKMYAFFAIIGYLFEHPLVQSILINLLQIASLFYLAFYRPLKDRIDLIALLLQEVILQLVHLCVFCLVITNPETDEELEDIESDSFRRVLGDIIIGGNMAFMAVGSLYILVKILVLLRSIYNSIRSKLTKKSAKFAQKIIKLETRSNKPSKLSNQDSETSLVVDGTQSVETSLNYQNKVLDMSRTPNAIREMHSQLFEDSKMNNADADTIIPEFRSSNKILRQNKTPIDGGIEKQDADSIMKASKINAMIDPEATSSLKDDPEDYLNILRLRAQRDGIFFRDQILKKQGYF